MTIDRLAPYIYAGLGSALTAALFILYIAVLT